MSRFIKIGAAAKLLGIAIQTLPRWEREKQIIPDYKFPGGARYLDFVRFLTPSFGRAAPMSQLISQEGLL